MIRYDVNKSNVHGINQQRRYQERHTAVSWLCYANIFSRLSTSSSEQLFDDVRSQIAIQLVVYYVILYCFELVPFRFRIFLLEMIKKGEFVITGICGKVFCNFFFSNFEFLKGTSSSFTLL